MAVIGTYALPGAVSVHNVVVAGERAYVAWYQHGLRVLDLDPDSRIPERRAVLAPFPDAPAL